MTDFPCPWRGWRRKFSLALGLEFSACGTFFARKSSLSNAVGPWVPARLEGRLGGQVVCGRSEIIRAAPTPASIERDCARTLDDKSSPAGQEGAGKSTPAKKSVLSLKSMEHTPTPDIATLSVGELKALISGAGLSYADCVEKSDLRARAAEARARLAPENSAVATYRAWRAETDAAHGHARGPRRQSGDVRRPPNLGNLRFVQERDLTAAVSITTSSPFPTRKKEARPINPPRL